MIDRARTKDRREISLAFAADCGVNWPVMKRIFSAVLGLFALCLPLGAQTYEDAISRAELEQTGRIDAGPALSLARSDLFTGIDSSLLLHGLPVVTLLDGRRFPISNELARMAAVDLPVAFLSAVDVSGPGASSRYGSDATGGVVNMQLSRIRTGGEVGFFYGKSGGKYGREDFAAHIIGGIGTDKFNITVGAAYHETDVKVPRSRRQR